MDSLNNTNRHWHETVKIIHWNVAPCSLVETFRRFGGTHYRRENDCFMGLPNEKTPVHSDAESCGLFQGHIQKFLEIWWAADFSISLRSMEICIRLGDTLMVSTAVCCVSWPSPSNSHVTQVAKCIRVPAKAAQIQKYFFFYTDWMIKMNCDHNSSLMSYCIALRF